MAGKDPKRRVTLNQLNVLWEHLNAHRDIALGHNKSAHARDHSRRLWQEVAEALNSMGEGATKSWKEWSSYWVDYKAKLKKKVSSMRAAMSGTGGGPSNAPVLQDIENRFLNLLGAGFGSGIPGVRVDPFPEMQQEADPPEEDVEMEYIIVPEIAPLSPAGSEPYRIVAATPPPPSPPPPSPPPPPPPRPPTPPPPAQGPVRRRRTRRRMADADRLDARSARRLLLDNNQERLEGQWELREILASIRDSLIRISDTMERIDRRLGGDADRASCEDHNVGPYAPADSESEFSIYRWLLPL